MRGVARYCEPFVEYSPREQQCRSPRKFTTVLCRTSIRLRGERSTASPVSSGSKYQHFATNSSQGGGHEPDATITFSRSEEHTSELQSRVDLVCRLLLEKKHDA